MTPDRSERLVDAARAEQIRSDLTRVVDRGPVGFVVTDKAGVIEWINATLVQWLGYDESHLIGQRTLQELLSPGGRIYYDTHVRPLVHMRHVANEIALELVCSDQRRLPVLINASLVIDERTGAESIETFVFDATRRRQYETELLRERQSAESAEARLQVMYDIVSGLAEAETVGDIVRVVTERASRSMHGANCSVWLLEPGDHAAARIEATSDGGVDRLVELEFPDGGPALSELAAGRIVLIADRIASADTYPLLNHWMAASGLRSAAIAPLITEGRLIGAMSYGYEDDHRFDDVELRTAQALAAQTEQALVRARILEVERRNKRLLENLLEFTTMLSAALTLGEVIDTIVDRGQQLLGAVGTRVALLDDSGTSVRFVRHGGSEGHQAISLPLDKRSIGCEAIRTNRVVVVDSGDELARRYPESPILDHPNFGRVMATPLRRGDEVLGAWVLAEGDAGPSGAIDATMFELFAEQAGQATQRAATHEAESLARAQADVRNVVSVALNRSMTTVEVGRAITDQGQAAFNASAIAVFVVDSDDHTSLDFQAGSGFDQAAPGFVSSIPIDDRLASLLNGFDAPIFAVGESDFDDLLERSVGAARDGSSAVLPLGVSGQILGLIVMGFDRPDALTSTMHVALSSLAAEAKVALLRARRYDLEHGVATTLQRSLLPKVSSVGDHWEVTTSHEPWSDLLEVGGDFFDVTPSDDGRILLVVGDVVGHGLAAAASMGLLRSAAKMLALITQGPAEVIEGLNAFAAVTPGVLYSSVCCVELRPDGAGRYSCAGHPFPVLRHRGGQTELLEGGRSPLLGVSNATPPTATFAMDVGSTLVAYSDGLIERRGTTVDAGLDRLRELLGTLGDSQEEITAEQVVRAMFDDQRREDDVVAVCVTRSAADGIR